MTALLSKDFFTAAFGKNLETNRLPFCVPLLRWFTRHFPYIASYSPSYLAPRWLQAFIWRYTEKLFGVRFRKKISVYGVTGAYFENGTIASGVGVSGKVFDETRKWNYSFTFISVML